MLRALLALVAVVLLAVPVRADDAVALLPLDAEARLEIYGQPVASEVARVVGAAKIDVVVVGAKMAVPPQAKLIVDGTIAAGKKDAIILTLRIRNPVDGVVVKTVSATAASIANIDKAAADVSAKLLASLRETLAATPPVKQPDPPVDPEPKRPTGPAAPEPRPLLVAITMTEGSQEALRGALSRELDAQLKLVLRTAKPTEPLQMSRTAITWTVKNSKLDLGMLVEVLRYDFTRATTDYGRSVPTARAAVRLRVSDAVGIVFDRVIVTDTIVGALTATPEMLAVDVAREVFDIARPHLKRKVTAWR